MESTWMDESKDSSKKNDNENESSIKGVGGDGQLRARSGSSDRLLPSVHNARGWQGVREADSPPHANARRSRRKTGERLERHGYGTSGSVDANTSRAELGYVVDDVVLDSGDDDDSQGAGDSESDGYSSGGSWGDAFGVPPSLVVLPSPLRQSPSSPSHSSSLRMRAGATAGEVLKENDQYAEHKHTSVSSGMGPVDGLHTPKDGRDDCRNRRRRRGCTRCRPSCVCTCRCAARCCKSTAKVKSPPAARGMSWSCQFPKAVCVGFLLVLMLFGVGAFLLYRIIFGYSIHEPPFKGCQAPHHARCPYSLQRGPPSRYMRLAAAGEPSWPPAAVFFDSQVITFCLDVPIGGAVEVQGVDWWNHKTEFQTIHTGNETVLNVTYPEFPVLPAESLRFRARSIPAGPSAVPLPWSETVTLTLPPCGYCGNAVNVRAARDHQSDMKPKIQGCIISCAAEPTCTQNCIVRDVNMTSSCAQCWVAEGQCTLQKCILPCLDPNSASCKQCSRDHCFPACVKCSGMPEWSFPE